VQDVPVAFLPGGRLLTTGPGGVWEWDVPAGRPDRLVIPLTSALRSIAVDPRSRWVVTLAEDGLGQPHDAATYRPVGPPLRAERPLVGVAFAEGGRTILGAVEGAGVRSWTLPDPDATSPVDGGRDELLIQTGTTLDLASGSVRPIEALAWRRLGRSGRPSPPETPADAARWHALHADSAEAEGNTFATLWHLDRLGPLRPGDWIIPARRAWARYRAGDIGGAGRELDAAAGLAGPGVLRDWELGQALAAREEGRHDLALWLLGRIIHAVPEDWRALVERSRAREFAGDEAGAEADLDRAASIGMEPTIASRSADRMAADGRWDRAADLLAELDRHSPDAPDQLAFRRAVASLMAGDQAGYRDACSRLLARALRRAPGVNANNAVYACALGPKALDDYGPAIALQAGMLGPIPPEDGRLRHVFLNTLGAVLLRSGDHAGAAARLRDGVDAAGGRGVDEDWIFLALATSAGGDPAAARSWLDRVPPPDPKLSPWDRAGLGLLRREAGAKAGLPRPELPEDVFRPSR